MKIHHLNCGTMCPVGGHFMDGFSEGVGSAHLVCHCLLIESDQGLILVDTGLGLQDVQRPRKRLNPIFRNAMRLPLKIEETAVFRIRNLGFDPKEVKHIVLTHLDFDHAGGIDDFPHAEVHVMAAELSAATHPYTPIAKGRYSQAQLSHQADWLTYQSDGERWFGFEAVRELRGLPPEILLVPLIGHTWGHAGVAIDTDEGWLLHAGDAYFYRGEMESEYKCTPGLRAYQTLMEVDRKQRHYNQKRLRGLIANHGEEVTIFSAHDALEYMALKEGVMAKGMKPGTSQPEADHPSLGLS